MKPTYNLAVNLPVFGSVAKQLREALVREPVDDDTLAYPDPAGPLWIRKSIASWLERVCGHAMVNPELLTLTLGARHAIRLALPATTADWNPAILVEERTYQGIRHLAHETSTRCVDVAMDQHGMRPDAFVEAVKRSNATVVYIQPTLQNPTTITMPFDRRLEIARQADMLGVAIIEGDVYSPLKKAVTHELPPFASIVPHRTFHAGGIGKILGPGLRVGWLLHPNLATQALSVSTIQLEHDGLPTLWPSIVARWMDDGTAERQLDQLTKTMTARGELARRILGPDVVTAGASLHAWLPTAEAHALEKRLLAKGVRVAASKPMFGIRKRADGIRLALGAEQDVGRLEEALRIVAQER